MVHHETIGVMILILSLGGFGVAQAQTDEIHLKS